MLAEAAHSVADTVNQLLLRVSLSLGERRPDREHPFGHGKDRFLWAFLAAVFIFVSGAVFSIGRGVYGLVSGGGEGGSFGLNYAVLAAFVAEGISLVRAYRQVRSEADEKGLPLRRFIARSSDPTTKTVLYEDSAAVVGLVIAFAGVGLHQATGSSAPDAAASIAVGLLLAYVAVRIARDSRAMLLGLGASPEDVSSLERVIRAQPEVKELIDLRTMYLGPRLLLVAVRLDFVDDIDASRVEQLSNELEAELRESVPEVGEVFLDATPRGRRPAVSAEVARAAEA